MRARRDPAPRHGAAAPAAVAVACGAAAALFAADCRSQIARAALAAARFRPRRPELGMAAVMRAPAGAAGRDIEIGMRVLGWFDRHGRKDLPWQRDISPY